MITRILITFVIFAGIAYYFNIDVRNVVERSGVPKWLSEKGIISFPSTTTTNKIESDDTSTTTEIQPQ